MRYYKIGNDIYQLNCFRSAVIVTWWLCSACASHSAVLDTWMEGWMDGLKGGEAIGSRDVGGKKKNKKGGSLNSDSFYDAIKKFGAGAKVSPSNLFS